MNGNCGITASIQSNQICRICHVVQISCQGHQGLVNTDDYFFKVFKTQMFVITTICDGDSLQEYCKSTNFDMLGRPRAYRCLRVNPTYFLRNR